MINRVLKGEEMIKVLQKVKNDKKMKKGKQTMKSTNNGKKN